MGNFRELLEKMHSERMSDCWGAYTRPHKKPIWHGKFEKGNISSWSKDAYLAIKKVIKKKKFFYYCLKYGCMGSVKSILQI